MVKEQKQINKNANATGERGIRTINELLNINAGQTNEEQDEVHAALELEKEDHKLRRQKRSFSPIVTMWRRQEQY